MFSQDEDFLALAHRYQLERIAFSGLVYAHQMRVTIGGCINDLELVAKLSTPADLKNHVEFLPL